MSDYTEETTVQIEEHSELQQAAAESPAPGGITAEAILARIDRMMEDKKYIEDAFAAVDRILTHQPSMNAADEGSRAKAEAIGDAVKSREATNQQILRFLEKMYDDCKPQSKASRNEVVGREMAELEKMEAACALSANLPPTLKELVIRSLTGMPEKTEDPFEKVQQLLDTVSSMGWDEVPQEIVKAIADGLSEQFKRSW